MNDNYEPPKWEKEMMKLTKKDILDCKLRDIGTGEVYYDPTSDSYNMKTERVNGEDDTALTVNLETGETFFEPSNSPAQKIEPHLFFFVKNKGE